MAFEAKCWREPEVPCLRNFNEQEAVESVNGALALRPQIEKIIDQIWDEGFDGIPLYLSSCFLAYLCRLFLRLIPQGDKMFDEDFTQEEIQVFKALSRITNVA